MPSATQSRPWYDRPLPIGTVAGVPVAVSTSWVLITIAMVIVFAPQVQRSLPYLPWVSAAGVALVYTLILAVSVLLHEVAHALAARAVGWTGSRIEITLWGGHTSFEAERPTPGRSLVVSLVGPAVNLVLGGLGLALQHAWSPFGVPGLLLYMGIWSNLAVGAFNLLPGLPLDGGRIVESAAWKATGSEARGTIAAGWAGRVLVVLAVAVLVWRVLSTREGLGLFTLAIVALVLVPLWTGAGASLRHGRLRRRLEAMRASELLRPVALLPVGAPVAAAVAAGVLTGTVVLTRPAAGGLLRVMPQAVHAVPEALRAGTPASQAAVPADDGAVLGTDADGDALARAALASVSGTVLVVDTAGTCVGAVSREDVIAAVEGRVEGERGRVAPAPHPGRNHPQ